MITVKLKLLAHVAQYSTQNMMSILLFVCPAQNQAFIGDGAYVEPNKHVYGKLARVPLSR